MKSNKDDFSENFLSLKKTSVMGIINVTPDSYFESGRTFDFNQAIKKAEDMLHKGADIIDVGGESTRPGAEKVDVNEEIDRVVPVVDYISKKLNAVVSIDTSNPKVMEQAVKAGATIINDVRALQRSGAMEIAAKLNVNVILMHSLVDQPNKDFVPNYKDIVKDISTYLNNRIDACTKAGIERKKLIIDPGFGGGMFGKKVEDDLELVKRFHEFNTFKLPMLAGISRKSFIGNILNKNAEDRLPGTLALTALLAMSGANILRVHDVSETVDVIKMINAIKKTVTNSDYN